MSNAEYRVDHSKQNKQANIRASKQTDRHVELVEGGAGGYGADVVDGACRWVHI